MNWKLHFDDKEVDCYLKKIVKKYGDRKGEIDDARPSIHCSGIGPGVWLPLKNIEVDVGDEPLWRGHKASVSLSLYDGEKKLENWKLKNASWVRPVCKDMQRLFFTGVSYEVWRPSENRCCDPCRWPFKCKEIENVV